MKTKIFAVIALLSCIAVMGAFAQQETAHDAAAETAVEEQAKTETSVWRYFAAALAVSVACIAGSMAVSKIGSAAMGAMSENAELSGKALPFVGLAEGICLWGFLVGLLIIVL